MPACLLACHAHEVSGNGGSALIALPLINTQSKPGKANGPVLLISYCINTILDILLSYIWLWNRHQCVFRSSIFHNSTAISTFCKKKIMITLNVCCHATVFVTLVGQDYPRVTNQPVTDVQASGVLNRVKRRDKGWLVWAHLQPEPGLAIVSYVPGNIFHWNSSMIKKGGCMHFS